MGFLTRIISVPSTSYHMLLAVTMPPKKAHAQGSAEVPVDISSASAFSKYFSLRQRTRAYIPQQIYKHLHTGVETGRSSSYTTCASHFTFPYVLFFPINSLSHRRRSSCPVLSDACHASLTLSLSRSMMPSLPLNFLSRFALLLLVLSLSCSAQVQAQLVGERDGELPIC